jgi:SnoaL-like domain
MAQQDRHEVALWLGHLRAYDRCMTNRPPTPSPVSPTTRLGAPSPEDLTRLFVERANAGDVDGMLDLYEADAVMAFPPGQLTVGRDAIGELFRQMVSARSPTISV